MEEIENIIAENARRIENSRSQFNPISGFQSIGERTKVCLPDYPISEMWLPNEMLKDKFIKKILRCGSIEAYTNKHAKGLEPSFVVDAITRVRCRYDFPFWAYTYVRIKPKEGGVDIPFKLNRPQLKLISLYEGQRVANKPIRTILLKARQWGGSTATQVYFAWLQLIHSTGLNSLIVSQVKDTSVEILDMFNRLLLNYPLWMLYPIGTNCPNKSPAFAGVLGAQNIHRIEERNCKIKIGSAEKPDSARGGDYQLVHCSETAFWKKTEGKTPEDIVRSACSSVLYRPMTAIVYESSANGTDNMFHKEWEDAKNGDSNFLPIFVAWFEIEKSVLPIEDEAEFAKWLCDNRNNTYATNEREEPGIFLWRLWDMGATLQNIKWYIEQRKTYTDHADMAAEYPSDDIEAFKHSGEMVFDIYNIDKLKDACRPPKYIGEVYTEMNCGADCLENLRFKEDSQGQLFVWELPEILPTQKITDRYLVVVDIGGRSKKADWSVIVVFDRYWMIEGDKPSVVAQWRGHIDMDLLAWKAAQIASFYDDALLVVESNTLETKDRDRIVDGNQAPFILNQIKDAYPNLYARKQSDEDIKEGKPVKYGFHTNVGNKPTLISHLVTCVRDQLWVERDKQVLDELRVYEKKPNGAFGAVSGKHDDLLMTRAIGLLICFQHMPIPEIVNKNEKLYQPKAKISEASLL